MLKLTKKADYGLIAVKHLAESAHQQAACSAKDIAEAYDLPQEALAKILQLPLDLESLRAEMRALEPSRGNGKATSTRGKKK